jgi:uncharacterized protein
MFLISYDCNADPDGRVLEPMLVANGQVGAGISLEYYFSTVEQRALRRRQQDHPQHRRPHGRDGRGELGPAHRPAFADDRDPRGDASARRRRAQCRRPGAIYARQPVLQELIGNGWVQLAAKDPGLAGDARRFVPGSGWVEWQGAATTLPVVKTSAEWMRGRRDNLPPALIAAPAEGLR